MVKKYQDSQGSKRDHDLESKSEITETFEVTMKQRVFALLEKYPDIQPMEMCRLLGLNHKKKGATMSSYKYDWKQSQWKKRQERFRLSIVNIRFSGRALKHMDLRKKEVAEKAVAAGWWKTKAYNKMFVWKKPNKTLGKLGLIEWFPTTGLIVVRSKKPSTKGRIKQLLADAFFPCFIDDINVFNDWADKFYMEGADLLLDTGQKLPYTKMTLLKDSNGVIVLTGDSSHPTCIEYQFIFPKWAKRNEVALKQNKLALQQNSLAFKQNAKILLQIIEFLKTLASPKPLTKDSSRMVA